MRRHHLHNDRRESVAGRGSSPRSRRSSVRSEPRGRSGHQARPQEDRPISRHLNQDQRRIWQDALAAVQETAANTDHESSSKQPLLTLVEQVRREPVAVLREVAWIELEPLVPSLNPSAARATRPAAWDEPQGALTR